MQKERKYYNGGDKLIKKFLLVFIVFIMIESCVNAKYIFQYELDVADLDIDRTKPVIELISISNTNKGYENYANKTHNITLKVKVIEKNMGTDTIENVETIIKVNGQELEDYKKARYYISAGAANVVPKVAAQTFNIVKKAFPEDKRVIIELLLNENTMDAYVEVDKKIKELEKKFNESK